MIVSFKCKETFKIWRGEVSRKLPPEIQAVSRRKLRMLNNAQDLKDLKFPPGNNLEALKGTRKGRYSIRVNDQWRVCFNFAESKASDVEIVDYHRG